MLYPLEVCFVLSRFVKVRMRPLGLFLDRPSDICNRAPADGLLPPPPPPHSLSAHRGKQCLPQFDLTHDVTLDS